MGRMYGRGRTVRPRASCTVATPNSPSRRTVSPSGRRMLRTTLWLMGNPILLNQFARIGYRHAPDLFRREAGVEQCLGEHCETFGHGRIDGLAEIGGKHAALR